MTSKNRMLGINIPDELYPRNSALGTSKSESKTDVTGRYDASVSKDQHSPIKSSSTLVSDEMPKVFLVNFDSFWNILNLEEGDQAWLDLDDLRDLQKKSIELTPSDLEAIKEGLKSLGYNKVLAKLEGLK